MHQVVLVKKAKVGNPSASRVRVPWSWLAAQCKWGAVGVSSLPEVGVGGTGQPEPPCRALWEERVPPRSVRAVPVGWGIPGAAPAWPHRKLLLLLAWELPTPGCSGLCRFCGGRTRRVSLETSCSTAAPPGTATHWLRVLLLPGPSLLPDSPWGGHGLGVRPRLSAPTFFFFFSFFFLFRSGSSSFFFFFFLWSESEGVSGDMRVSDELGILQGGTEEGAAAAAWRSPLPGGTGSWVRLCLCLCLFFFLGGWMCISRHCSGSWGGEMGLVRPGRAPPSPTASSPSRPPPGSQPPGLTGPAWRRKPVSMVPVRGVKELPQMGGFSMRERRLLLSWEPGRSIMPGRSGRKLLSFSFTFLPQNLL